MKKIAIVSCYFQPNYGSMLQAYATQMILDKLGYENETIRIDGLSSEIKKSKIKYFAKASLTSGILFSKIGRAKDAVAMRIKHNDYTINKNKRNEQFKLFSEKYFRLSQVYSSKAELQNKCEELYSTVIVGSDQLWLPGNIAADYYTLSFVPKSVNSIAYATSFGQSSLPRSSEKKAKGFLNEIRHISVREVAGQKIIKKLTGRKVPVVCDPTLLFSAEEWMSIQHSSPIIKGRYIFCYFLGNNKNHRAFVKKLRNKIGYKVVILPHIDEYVEADEWCSDIQLYNIDPAGFINLIRNAEYICTDSFHCSVFSILYKKKFFTFRRFTDDSSQSTNNRLVTLFNLTRLKSRFLFGNEKIDDCISDSIDYELVDKRIEIIREKSLLYLKESIWDSRGTDL